jgi:hypothetical protein
MFKTADYVRLAFNQITDVPTAAIDYLLSPLQRKVSESLHER